MKKALVVVALMVAAMAGWCETTDWAQMYGDVPAVVENEIGGTMWFYEFMAFSPEDDIDSIVVSTAARSDNIFYPNKEDLKLYNSDGTDYRLSINSDSFFIKPRSGIVDTESWMNYVINNAIENHTDGLYTSLLFATGIEDEPDFDLKLSDYLIVNFDENGNPQANTWKSFGAVPEPASGLLIVMGSVLLAFRRKVA